MIEFKNVTKKYGNHIIIDNFNYQFEYGNIYVVWGKSGSGKTTLLKLISAIIDPDEGEVWFDDKKIYDYKKTELLRNRFSFVYQDYKLIEEDTVEKNLSIATKYTVNKSCDVVLQNLGILDKKNDQVFTLSGGQKQRVAIARAWLKNHDVILMDELTGNLDDESSHNVIELIKSMISDDKIIIIVTHNKQILEIADFIIKL